MFEMSFALSLTDTGKRRRKARSRRSAFARFTRYSASDIAPAIATAVAPSREKIFWTTLDPTKNPFEARLSAARTTPSLLRMPTVVVMLNLGPLCLRSGKLIRVPETKSHGGQDGRSRQRAFEIFWGWKVPAQCFLDRSTQATSKSAPKIPAGTATRNPNALASIPAGPPPIGSEIEWTWTWYSPLDGSLTWLPHRSFART